METERRGTPRTALEVEISLGSDSHFYTGLTNDVSEGGVFVVTYATFAVGDEIAVQFQLPTCTVQARARVRWTRPLTEHAPPGVGLGFVELADADRHELERFCHARAPLYYDDVD